jgi:hypothetical protein
VPSRKYFISVTDVEDAENTCEEQTKRDFLKRYAVNDGSAIKDHPQSLEFDALTSQFLSEGLVIRFQARGASMLPSIDDGEMVYIEPVSKRILRKKDIVLAKGECGFRLHRLVRIDAVNDLCITRGDCRMQDDPPVECSKILGVAVAKDVHIAGRTLRAEFYGVRGWTLRSAARLQSILRKLVIALNVLVAKTSRAR